MNIERNAIFKNITSGLSLEIIKQERKWASEEVEGWKRLSESSDTSPVEGINTGLELSKGVKQEYDKYTDEELLENLQNMFNEVQILEDENNGDYMHIVPYILEKYPNVVELLVPLVQDVTFGEKNSWPHSLATKITAYRGTKTRENPIE